MVLIPVGDKIGAADRVYWISQNNPDKEITSEYTSMAKERFIAKTMDTALWSNFRKLNESMVHLACINCGSFEERGTGDMYSSS